MDGTFEEDSMSPEEYAAWKKKQIKAKPKTYTLEEVSHLLSKYQEYAEDYTAMWYDISVTLPSSKEWLALNK